MLFKEVCDNLEDVRDLEGLGSCCLGCVCNPCASHEMEKTELHFHTSLSAHFDAVFSLPVPQTPERQCWASLTLAVGCVPRVEFRT